MTADGEALAARFRGPGHRGVPGPGPGLRTGRRYPSASRPSRLTDAESAALEPVRVAVGAPVSDERLLRWLMAWKTVFGHVSLELFGHMHRGVLDYDAHFHQVTDQLTVDLGL